MKNADLGGRRKVRSGCQTIFNSVAQPQPAARERVVMMRVPMMSSQSLHGEYVKYGRLVRSSAGLVGTGVARSREPRVGTGHVSASGASPGGDILCSARRRRSASSNARCISGQTSRTTSISSLRSS